MVLKDAQKDIVPLELPKDIDDFSQVGSLDKIIKRLPRVKALVEGVLGDSDKRVSAMKLGHMNVGYALDNTINKGLNLVAENAENYSNTGRIDPSKEICDQVAREFSSKYPKIAGELELNNESEDRLLADRKNSLARIAIALANETTVGEAEVQKEADNMTSSDVIKEIKRAVAKAKKGESAAEILASKGINKDELVARGLCQDKSQGWHSNIDGQGLELLLPLGVGQAVPIMGQPPEGPQTVFDGEWDKLGYTQEEVDKFRMKKEVWWHTAETTHLMRL
ncbi:MAG: hypothetical protein GF334_06380, partial [Candidatus Altiarchaeales archaeon]|nr:hypothetical protein [Candidatus Altiarchaeales archaeon]